MRLAVFSDLHGNPYACKAVLQEIARDGPFDAIVAAGDLCLGGSDPAACVDLLRAAGVVGLYGNTEEYIKTPFDVPNDELHRSMWHKIQPVAYWIREQLDPDQLNWLHALPFERRFSPTEKTIDALLVVHANPKNVELMIYPAPEEQLLLWGEVRQADNDPLLGEALEDVTAGMLVFGHFHTVFQRRWQDLLLVDVACCSLPGIDNDPRARYTTFTWESAAWQVRHHWVEYNASQELAALYASGMPFKEDFIRYFE